MKKTADTSKHELLDEALAEFGKAQHIALDAAANFDEFNVDGLEELQQAGQLVAAALQQIAYLTTSSRYNRWIEESRSLRVFTIHAMMEKLDLDKLTKLDYPPDTTD